MGEISLKSDLWDEAFELTVLDLYLNGMDVHDDPKDVIETSD